MTSAFLTMHRKALVLNEIGTGKTQSALWACDYLMKIGKVKKALIILTAIYIGERWGDSIFMNFPNRISVTLHGTSVEERNYLVQMQTSTL